MKDPLKANRCLLASDTTLGFCSFAFGTLGFLGGLPRSPRQPYHQPHPTSFAALRELLHSTSGKSHAPSPAFRDAEGRPGGSRKAPTIELEREAGGAQAPISGSLNHACGEFIDFRKAELTTTTTTAPHSTGALSCLPNLFCSMGSMVPGITMEGDSLGNGTLPKEWRAEWSLLSSPGVALDMRGFLLVFILGPSVFCRVSCSLLNFKVMIERITKRNALIYYNGYGCYCGKGGRGQPRDKTDKCCFNHDCCYESLHQRKCHPFVDHYRYLIINGEVLCNYRNKSICSTLACECDREATQCFRKEAQTYSLKWRHYPGVLCKEATPRCPAEKPVQGSGPSPRNQTHPLQSGASHTGKKPGAILQQK
ncbi:hypothetical protein JRQ81_009922 [Phrynocephalus forsythii]|uniref:Phospholipase A2 n=1 Tax=Phrynocephalus forsythii TaxID=171643 RepID=A0A9Q0XB37_9SAUR|nr:hypothetical protein JRQ81_009922 [Phrynocephalus forsythii]